MSSVQVRWCTAEMVDAMRAMRLEALAQEAQYFCSRYDDEADQSESFWCTRCATTCLAFRYNSASAGAPEIVGIAGLVDRGASHDKVLGSWAEIVSLYVRQAFRRLGIASMLVRACLSRAAQKGAIDTAVLKIYSSNERMRAAALRLGFVLYGCELNGMVDYVLPIRAVRGVDFNALVSTGASAATAVEAVLTQFFCGGQMGTEFARANALLQVMVAKRRELLGTYKICLGFTSNLISSGLREIFQTLCSRRCIDLVCTTAGGVEEDVIKGLGTTHLGDFAMRGAELRRRGLNRVGNLLVPNNNYVAFEDFFVPFLDEVLHEQQRTQFQTLTTPSEMISRLGSRSDSSCMVHAASANKIPVFCPALTDGSMGDMIYFHAYRNPGLIVDAVQDVQNLDSALADARDAGCGVILLGAGLPKHHLLSSLRRVGGRAATEVLMITTGTPLSDGSVSSCTIADDRSQGLLAPHTSAIRFHGDATLVFPLLAAQVFGGA